MQVIIVPNGPLMPSRASQGPTNIIGSIDVLLPSRLPRRQLTEDMGNRWVSPHWQKKTSLCAAPYIVLAQSGMASTDLHYFAQYSAAFTGKVKLQPEFGKLRGKFRLRFY